MQQLSEAIQRHARATPGRVALTFEGQRIHYGDLPTLIEACAIELRAELAGFDPKRPIALVGGSTPGLAIYLLSMWHLGYGVLPQSERLPEAERNRIAEQANASTMLRVKEHDTRRRVSSTPPTDLRLDGWLALPSSGTTGQPKVVRRDGEAIDAVARQVRESVGYRSDDRVYAAVPLTHAYGLEAGLLAPILAGATIELENAFAPSLLGTRIAETRATILTAVPAMIDMLVQMHDENNQHPYPDLRRLLCAGAPLPESLWHQCKAKLKLKPANYYGATEMGSVCLADPDRAGHDATWLGHAMPGVEMRILDPDSHRPLPDGAFGEIAVHAPSAMTGYIQSDGVVDRESAFVWINNKKYFLTGDLGTRDPSGHLRYQARRKLLIDVGANKVNPIEVESILCLHPRVSAAMVSGERLNQTVHRLSAVVEPSDEEHPPTAAELRAHCRHHLAAWKVPRTFTFETLARTALGKVIRVKPEVVPN